MRPLVSVPWPPSAVISAVWLTVWLKVLIITRFKSVYEFPVFLSHTPPSPSPVLPVFPVLKSTMVNWESPVTIANELCSLIPSFFLFLFPLNSLSPAASLVKFIHVIDGIYLCVSSFISGDCTPTPQCL
jgi:hypothetical protein